MTKKVLGLTDNFSKKKKRNCVTSAWLGISLALKRFISYLFPFIVSLNKIHIAIEDA
jgi:hypothetical protein